MIPYSRRGRSAAAVALSAAVSCLALAACSAEVPQPAALPTHAVTKPSPGPALSGDQQRTVDTAWTSFEKLNGIYLKAVQTGRYDWNKDATRRPLYRYAGGRYMALLERDLGLLSEQGLIRTGTPTVTLRRVVSVSATSIVVEACVDDAGTDTVNKKTRKSVAAPGQNKRYPVTLRAGLYPDSVWRWVDSHTDRAASC
ncbi:hypothetical protein Cme02nite_46470 [Catellatospora methionotrophica]|uniref:Lipoprotein n=1 Tax=Catellatospora methionotrophica TaxID=121620 RepID=A0A8J3LKR0_9ACTN|nr:hypothetical protein [Catellatospora methionotrophica]GIG16315.1 hypothetical protein Cme02nite_46470 [Catellatospora methionotrophica]